MRIVSPLGPTEDEACRLDRVGEAGVLGEEAVAGMDRVGAGRGGRVENGGDVEIGFGGLRRPDIDGLVSHLHSQRIRIGRAVGLYRRHAKLPRGALDAHGDLAAIGDEQPREAHSRHLDEQLAGHHRVFVIDCEFDDLAGGVGLHLDERLHHLDQADHLADGDLIALRLERRLVGRGLAIEGAGEG